MSLMFSGGKEKDQWHNPVYLMQFLDFDQNLHEGFGRIYFSGLAKFVLAVDMTMVWNLDHGLYNDIKIQRR